MNPKESKKYIPVDTGWEDPPDEPPNVAKIEGVGRVFRRNVAASSELSYEIKEDNDQTVTMTYEMVLQEERVVRVISFLDEKTGLIGYMSLDTVPDGFHPSDYPHVPISNLSTTDRATIERDLINVLKKGASKPFFDLDAKILERGGDPSYRVPKSEQGMWHFSQK